MLYDRDGRTTIAATLEQHDRLKSDGWEIAPLAAHRQRPVSHHGFIGTHDNDPLLADNSRGYRGSPR